MNFSTLWKNWPSEGLSIPEGWNDGSLARSAWEGRTQGSVPLGYGVSSLSLSNELARALKTSQLIRQLPDEKPYYLWDRTLDPMS